MNLPPGSSIEGYTLVRKIGEGGFGEVWLSKSETTGAWKAIKWISRQSHRHLEQELSALSRYANAVSGLRSPNLVPIEHVRLLEDGLIYVMPVSDGFNGLSPEDPNWEPMTLRGVMDRHQLAGKWFSLDEIKNVILGVVQGAALIAEAGLQHRDIKPENVLFIGGEPALADFGLAAEDATRVSMRGTPYHAAPTWYLESGGNADQWGVAILIYQLLTGNSPDKMGRPKYLQPAEGMAFHGLGDRAEWIRLQSLVNRATSEVVGERFQGFEAFRKGLLGEVVRPVPQSKGLKFSLVVAGLFLAILGAFLFLKNGRKMPDIAGVVSRPVAIPQKAQTPSNPSPDQPPAILQETDKPHILSQRDVEQMNQYTSKKASKAAEDAVKGLGTALDGLPQSKSTPQ